MIPITFRQLEVFVRVVEAGSFRACAEQLSISQASVGEHVRGLERQLGCPLFERRRGSAAVLTQMGDQVFHRAQAILATTVDLLATFDRAPRDRMRRRIRIGAHGFIAEALSKRLARFVGAHPGVNIELQRRSFADVVSGLAQSEIEIGYFLSRGPVPEVESFIAWREAMGLFVGAGHRLAGREHVGPEDLAGEPFAYLPARTHLRGEIDSILTELGIAECPVAITADDHLLILENLLAGRSFACLFADWLAPHVERGEVVQLALSVPVPPIQVRYAVRIAYRADRTAGALLERLNRTEGQG
ncbi:MAG: LysR family transcriptional regulator [Sphingomonadaceae bacterium]|nr:LysR family transcriptional regulator [Sphingomonadaceae bacterium]